MTICADDGAVTLCIGGISIGFLCSDNTPSGSYSLAVADATTGEALERIPAPTILLAGDGPSAARTAAVLTSKGATAYTTGAGGLCIATRGKNTYEIRRS